MKKCGVQGCDRPHRCKGLCNMHYQRVCGGQPAGEPELRKTPNGTGYIRAGNYREFADGDEHVLIVERILGHKLPKQVKVHHVDGNGTNNEHTNLVVCPSQGYHMLLHQRQRALDKCGNANWLKCNHCKRYDDPANLYIKKDRHQGFHRSCEAKYKREKRHADQM